MTKLHHYKGFTFEKSEGCEYWNIWKPEKIRPFGGKNEIEVWCGECVGYGRTIKECKISVDYFEEA